MTGKQRAMIAERLKDPRAPNSEIIKRAGYRVNGTQSASQIYLENLNKPEIRTQLSNVSEEVEEVLISTIREFKDSGKQWERTLANENSKWIHDKVHGKATQKIQQESTSVNIEITL